MHREHSGTEESGLTWTRGFSKKVSLLRGFADMNWATYRPSSDWGANAKKAISGAPTPSASIYWLNQWRLSNGSYATNLTSLPRELRSGRRWLSEVARSGSRLVLPGSKIFKIQPSRMVLGVANSKCWFYTSRAASAVGWGSRSYAIHSRITHLFVQPNKQLYSQQPKGGSHPVSTMQNMVRAYHGMLFSLTK